MPAETVTEATQQTTEAPQEETTVPQEETTAPAHSEWYLPGYSAEQIWGYFEEVVLHMEYTDGTGDASLVQKWNAPIYYRIYGEPTQEDLGVLEACIAQLNAVPGFPGIYAATEDQEENLTLNFLTPEPFYNMFSVVVNGEESFGATQFWYYTDTNEIYTANIGYRTDIDQLSRNSILIEEIINTLGITDTVLRPDSIVYQYSDENMTLSDVDWLIMRLLYHPQMQSGMNADDCKSIIEELYY